MTIDKRFYLEQKDQKLSLLNKAKYFVSYTIITTTLYLTVRGKSHLFKHPYLAIKGNKRENQ